MFSMNHLIEQLHGYGDDFASSKQLFEAIGLRRREKLPLAGAAVLWIEQPKDTFTRTPVRVTRTGKICIAHAEYF